MVSRFMVEKKGINMVDILCVTKHHGQVVSAPASYLVGPEFKSWSRDQLSWLMFFVVFLSSSRQMLG
jgi:hypothetical protein